MRKHFYLMAMAIVVLGFTACTDDHDNTVEPVVVTDDKPFDYE